MNVNQPLDQLEQIALNHPLWKNKLFIACEQGTLTINDFKFLFSQYYYYSKNFSRLLAAMMVNCDNDYYRSKLTQNLWEESGERELNNRHAEIFRKFLTNSLHIVPEQVHFEEFTKQFVNSYLEYCLESTIIESSAALSLGTEGIVAKMYTILKLGLLKAGIQPSELEFFDIHITCDDEHAQTIKEIMLLYTGEKNWFERCKTGLLTVLDLRLNFFNSIYDMIIQQRINPLISYITNTPATLKLDLPSLKFDTLFNENLLYSNSSIDKNLCFNVFRLPFSVDVLDPRLVTIASGCHNEYHQHAHETIFLILHGSGTVVIEDKSIPVQVNDIVHVPRWLRHQTINTGQEELRFFAVTDYGLTKRIPVNSEKSYRMIK